MKIIFFSDTHLDKAHPKKAKIVETFLREVCAEGDVIFLVGDLFEFYHGFAGVYPWFQGVADALRDLTAKGKTVYFLEGNHEYDMGSYFQSYTGVECAESISMDVDGERLFVSHGDSFTGGRLREILKSSLTGRVMDFLGPRLTWIGAMAARVFLSKKTEKSSYSARAVKRFRGYAERKFNEGFDVVVMAHSHIPDRMESVMDGLRKVYFNTGDFFAHSTYLFYETGTGFEMRKHSYAKRKDRK